MKPQSTGVLVVLNMYQGMTESFLGPFFMSDIITVVSNHYLSISMQL